MENIGFYIANKDGEIVDILTKDENYIKLQAGDKVIRRNTISYLKETMDIKYHFIKVNPKKFDYYCKKYSILPTLVCHIGYLDNICEFDNGKCMSVKGIARLCGVGESTAKRQIKGMISDDILHKVKDGKSTYYMLNPWLCVRGKRVLMETYNHFKNSTLRDEAEKDC